MEKIWLNSYEKGVAAEIDITRYSSIVDMISQSVERYRHKTAFSNRTSFFSRQLSYQELDKLSDQFASFLQHSLKLSKGERVAIMMPNILQYPITAFGILKAGLAVVNINPLYTPRELEHQLNDSGATTIVVLENFANTLELVLPQVNIKNIIIASIGDLFGIVSGSLINLIARKIKKVIPNYQIPNAISFKEALNQGMQQKLVPIELTHEDLAFLQYTGGTTGIAKGAMLTHGNICANVLQASEWIVNKLVLGEEVVIAALPLYHILALTINLLVFFHAGGHTILITNPRDLDGFIKELKKYPITVFIGLNTLFNGLLNKPSFKEINFKTWKLTVAGGTSTQGAIAKKWKEITGLPIVEAYGLTEASPGVCVNPLNITESSDGIGLPIPSTEVQLRDGQGNLVSIGQAGELWIRGPQVMAGYWNRPNETAKVIDKEGWLETGDIACMNEKGWLKIVDRKKDLIIVSGFNVYPNEIEEVVAHHPKVQEVACVGVKSDKTGEAIKLFVVKKDDSLTKEELIEYCRTQLTAYKIPREIEFRDELPKSNVGKILRRQLR